MNGAPDPHPHADQPRATAGVDPEAATAGVVLVHGRGARAHSMLPMAEEFDADGVAYVAPQAARGTWYPNSFMAPMESNEPHLSSALRVVAETVGSLVDAGIPREHVLLVGFSQGACLASEYLARNADRYGGLGALSGGLIGPEGTARDYDGSLDGTPAFVGCSDADPHIPQERVEETAAVLDDLGADVDTRIYEGMGHTVVDDELDAIDAILADVVAGAD